MMKGQTFFRIRLMNSTSLKCLAFNPFISFSSTLTVIPLHIISKKFFHMIGTCLCERFSLHVQQQIATFFLSFLRFLRFIQPSEYLNPPLPIWQDPRNEILVEDLDSLSSVRVILLHYIGLCRATMIMQYTPRTCG